MWRLAVPSTADFSSIFLPCSFDVPSVARIGSFLTLNEQWMVRVKLRSPDRDTARTFGTTAALSDIVTTTNAKNIEWMSYLPAITWGKKHRYATHLLCWSLIRHQANHLKLNNTKARELEKYDFITSCFVSPCLHVCLAASRGTLLKLQPLGD